MSSLQDNTTLHQRRLNELAAAYSADIAPARVATTVKPAPRTLQQLAWSMALKQAGGDPHRIQRCEDGSLLVTNRSRRPSFLEDA